MLTVGEDRAYGPEPTDLHSLLLSRLLLRQRPFFVPNIGVYPFLMQTTHHASVKIPVRNLPLRLALDLSFHVAHSVRSTFASSVANIKNATIRLYAIHIEIGSIWVLGRWHSRIIA